MQIATQIQSDEMLHSFLIRRILMSGVPRSYDIHRIFSRGGKWLAIPQVGEKFDPAFADLDYASKIKLIQSKLKIWKTGFSTNPLNIPWIVSKIFFGDPNSIPFHYEGIKSFPIRFCPHCFSSQLRRSGFTWFRHNWANQTHCDRHGTRLFRPKCEACQTNKQTTFIDLMSCLCGVCHNCGKDFWHNATLDDSRAFEPYELKQPVDGDVDRLPAILPRYVPCLIWNGLFKIPWAAARAQFRNPAIAKEDSIKKLLAAAELKGETNNSMNVVSAYLKFLKLRSLGISLYDELLTKVTEKVSLTVKYSRKSKASLPYYTLKSRDCYGCALSVEDCPLKRNSGVIGITLATSWDFRYMG